jgi:uncharacterized LabA/DUF88 family protein
MADEAKRTIVFIDYQNVAMDARRAFSTKPYGPADGQIDPIRYGRHLASLRPLGTDGARDLKQVRVYRGRPHSEKDRKTHAAHMRQVSRWDEQGVEVIARDLRYPQKWPKEKAEEKGIDVALAIDAIRMAISDELDIAILATTDTDQRPVLEAFHQMPLAHSPVVEVAAWKSPTMRKKLQVRGYHVWSHFLEEDVYRRVRDTRDYNLPK